MAGSTGAKQYAPYKPHGKSSVKAKGVVSGNSLSRDGKTATVTVRHEPPKKKKPSSGGVFGLEASPDYPQESTHTMPAEHAKRFPVGSQTSVMVGPGEEVGDSEEEGGETGGGAEDEGDEGEESTSTPAAAMGGKGPKQAKGKGGKPPAGGKGGKDGSVIRAAVNRAK